MKKTGFTLLEVLLGIGLTAVLLTSVNILLSTTLSSSRKASVMNVVKSEGAYALDAMSIYTKYSMSASCGANTLTVTKVDGEDADLLDDVVTYFFDGDGIASQSAFGTSALTSNRVLVSACPGLGSLYACSADNRSVSICFVVRPATSSDISDTDMATFETVVTLRNR